MKFLLELTVKELVVVGALLFYITTDLGTPGFIARVMDSAAGKLIAVLAGLMLFRKQPVIIVILGVYALYVLVERSGYVVARDAIQEHTPSQLEKDIVMNELQPVDEVTLEEELVAKFAPINSEIAPLIDTTFKPTAADVNGASAL